MTQHPTIDNTYEQFIEQPHTTAFQSQTNHFLTNPDNIQISEELDNVITLQQQLLSPRTLTINQVSSTITSSNPPTPTSISDYIQYHENQFINFISPQSSKI